MAILTRICHFKLSFLRYVKGAKVIISRIFVSDILLGIGAAQSAAGQEVLWPYARDGGRGKKVNHHISKPAQH